MSADPLYDGTKGQHAQRLYDELMADARTAIEALRNPPPLVILNAGETLNWPSGGGDALRETWEALIEAALKD